MSEVLDDKTVLTEVPEGKIFHEQGILAGTFLGGPLVTGYFMAENFRAIDQKHKISRTWIIAILITFLLAAIALAIPESANFPNQLIPITYTGIAYGIYKYYQEKPVNAFLKNGGQQHSWGRIIIVSLIGMVITLAIIVGFGFIWDSIEQQNIVTKKYGTAVVHEIDYYKNNITESEVDQIADALTKTGFFDEYSGKFVWLKKRSDKYDVHISVIQGSQHDPEAIEYFTALQKDMDNEFPENKVVLKLVTEYVDNVVKTIE